MRRERFALALERLPASAWERFEQLASQFLASEFSNLRTVASPSGDQGRDAFLFQDGDDPAVLLQYSVTTAWGAKILATASRIAETFPNTRVLIYVTNQDVGAAADATRDELRQQFGLFLDVRDRGWFLDRVNSDAPREAAAEALAEDFVDPYLAGRGVIASKAQALSGIEAQAACVYLKLQWEDDTREKGLTRLSFEALVRAALRETDAEHRLARADIHQRIADLLPGHDPARVSVYTNSALARLDKRAIRNWRADDTFCLSFDERTRLQARLEQLEADDARLTAEIETGLAESATDLGINIPTHTASLVRRVRRILENLLLQKGEQFASAVAQGALGPTLTAPDAVQEAVVTDLGSHPDELEAAEELHGLGGNVVPLIKNTILQITADPSDDVQRYLRSLADSYTLFAFLRETPDVQRAVVKMFSHGEIWFDTTVVLPLFAEELLDPGQRLYTNMLRAARESGLKLFMTEGVLEELERHMNRALIYARRDPTSPQWQGRVPFLAASYLLTGRSRSGFADWILRFRGDNRPADDIAEYAEREFGIEIQDLAEWSDAAAPELRAAVQEVWHEVHDRRRLQGRNDEFDQITVYRLVEHDVENYLGVVMRRRDEARSGFGYSSWWLTLDSTAFAAPAAIAASLGYDAPPSPAMSPDFMVNYLALGPLRGRVSRSTEATLPLLPDMVGSEYVPDELIQLADRIRDELKDLPEHVVRRLVRDALDSARKRVGVIGTAGTAGLLEQIRAAVVGRALHDLSV